MAYAVFTAERQSLIDRAGIDEDWLQGSLLDSILTEAASAHNTAYSFAATISNLPQREAPAVRLLAWSEVMRCRASRFATQQDTRSPQGFGTDKNTPFHKCMSLSEQLAKDYTEMCKKLGVRPANGVTEGFMITLDNVVSARARGPFTVIPAAVLTGQAALDVDNAWTIEWDFEKWPDFEAFIVFYDTGSTQIRQQWNQGSDTGIPQIRDGLEPLYTINNQEQVQLKITDLDTGVTHRILFVTRSRTGAYGYSNELVITS